MSANLNSAADAALTRKPVDTGAAGRFTTGTMVDISRWESVGAGVLTGKAESDVFAVYQSGKGQTVGIPLYAVAALLATGKAVSPAAIVQTFKDAGTLAKLKAAVDAASA